jgi:hypothetical protein
MSSHKANASTSANPAAGGGNRPATGEAAARAERWLVPAGLGLIGIGMILVVLGTQIAPLFMPGTWLILVGLLGFAGVGILHAMRKPGAR